MARRLASIARASTVLLERNLIYRRLVFVLATCCNLADWRPSLEKVEVKEEKLGCYGDNIIVD